MLFLFVLVYILILNIIPSLNIIIKISKLSNVFAEPYLFPKEKNLFYYYLDKSHSYFEYGSSGIIHQAAKRGLIICSAEVSQAWVLYLKKEIQKINRYLGKKVNITYLYSDIQSKLNADYDDFKKYVTLYNHRKYNADLIYINGYYHASCAMNIYDQIDNTTIIIIRDIDKKERNKIKAYYDQICKVQRTFVFRKKNPAPILNIDTIEKVENNDFNHKGRLVDTLKFLRYNFNETIIRYLNYNNEEMMIKPNKKQVWFLWWQGMQNAPPIVKLCLATIERNLPDGEITVLTNESLPQIIKFPSFIYERVQNKTISLNHFSDLTRVSVLSNYGGLWMDATIITSKKVPSDIFEIPYYTIHFDDTFKYITGKWTGFFQASYINNIVPKFTLEIFLEYVKRFETIFDYFFLDFIMLVGYHFIPSFRRTIESVPFNNPGVLEMGSHINDIYTPESFEFITKDTVFFKSSWKINLFYEVNEQKTIFGYYISKYLNNSK